MHPRGRGCGGRQRDGETQRESENQRCRDGRRRRRGEREEGERLVSAEEWTTN